MYPKTMLVIRDVGLNETNTKLLLISNSSKIMCYNSKDSVQFEKLFSVKRCLISDVCIICIVNWWHFICSGCLSPQHLSHYICFYCISTIMFWIFSSFLVLFDYFSFFFVYLLFYYYPEFIFIRVFPVRS